MLECYPGRRPVAEALARLLQYHGATRLGVRFPYEGRKLAELGFQYVGVEMLVRGYSVSPGSRRGRSVFRCGDLSIIAGSGGEESTHIVARGRGIFGARELEAGLGDPYPIIVIDLSLMKIHTPEELSSLRIQLAMSLAETRKYLWDRHLALTSAPENVDAWLWPVAGRHRMIVTRERPGELLWRMKADRVIILRPDAREELKPREVIEAHAFVIGGIVDKIPRPGLSRMLDSSVPWGEPRRLTLRGSIIGVPERIHRIVGALLRARLDMYGLVERALVEYMARQDRVARIFYELQRRRRKSIGLCSALREFEWLGADRRDIELAASRARVDVVDDCRG